MKLYQRKRRIAAQAAQAVACPFAENGYQGMTQDELTEIGRAAGLPPFCGSWPRETLIAKIEKAKSNGS